MNNRLKQLRQELNLTQQELANKLNLSKPTISKYEAGTVDMSSDTLKACSKIFNCSTDYILGNSDIRNDSENNTDLTCDPIRNQLISEIKAISEKLDIVEIMALRSILDGNFSLVHLKDMLAKFQEAVQVKK